MSAATRQRASATAVDDAGAVRPGYKWTEAGEMLGDWQLRPVGRMGEVVTGKALAVNAPGIQRGYLRTTNVLDGQIDLRDILTMPMTDAQFEHFRILRGDVLLNEGQSLELVGRCAIYRDEASQPLAMQNQLLRFRARERVSAEFASHLFRHCQQTRVFARIALQTTSIAHLGGSRFERLVLAWPPTEQEQRAIAEALSDVDGLLGALEALIAKKRAIKQAAMQQLLTGKTRLPGFSGAWETKRLGEDVILLSGQHVMAHNWNQVGLGTPYLTGPADFPEGRIQQTKFTLSPTTLCRPGDILVTVKGSGCGTLIEADDEYCISRQLMAIRSVGWNSRLLFYSLLQNASSIAAASAGLIPGLSRNHILDQLLPLPSDFKEQTAIATVLSDMDAEIAALERRRDKTRAIKEGMMQQLLTGRVRLGESGKCDDG